MPADWTLDDLVTRVEAALTAADYPGAPNGRVREVPDRRAIRWYTTIGLLDRPTSMRGRTALYGPRHLAQLVAIKHRQAQGRTLAEIQAELVGASDTTLSEIAGVPAPEAAPTTTRRAFWTQPAAAVASAEPTTAAVASAEPTSPSQGLLTGVPLDGGAVLLLPAAPNADDVAAVRAAARPLLDLLAHRGLLSDPRRADPSQRSST